MSYVVLLYNKYSNKRARNMKLASIFFTASAVYVRAPSQIYVYFINFKYLIEISLVNL